MGNHTGGEESANKRQWHLKSRQCVERTRGGGATRIVATTSREIRGKWVGGRQQTRSDGVSKAGGASRWWEAEVVLQDDTKRKQCIVKTRGWGGATRCDATISQGNLKVNGRRTIPPPPSKETVTVISAKQWLTIVVMNWWLLFYDYLELFDTLENLTGKPSTRRRI